MVKRHLAGDKGPSSADNTVIVTAKAIDYGVSNKRAIAAPRMGDAPHVTFAGGAEFPQKQITVHLWRRRGGS